MKYDLIILAISLSLGCGTSKPNVNSNDNINSNKSIEFTEGDFTDPRDGFVYSTVTYPNGQTWMTENMLYYRDSSVQRLIKHPGTSLPDEYQTIKYMWVKCGDKECKGHSTNTYEPSEHKGLGLFYDFESAKLACPKGWHVATLEDWQKFMNQFEHSKTKLQNGDYLTTYKLLPEHGLNLLINPNAERDDYGKLLVPQYYWSSLVLVERAYQNGDLFSATTVKSFNEGYDMKGNLSKTDYVVSEKEIDIYRQYLPCRCIKD